MYHISVYTNVKGNSWFIPRPMEQCRWNCTCIESLYLMCTLVSLKPLWGFQMNDNCWQWPEKMLSLCLKVLVIIWWQLINLSAGPVCRHHHHILADLNWLHSQESRRYILWGKYYFEAVFELICLFVLVDSRSCK